LATASIKSAKPKPTPTLTELIGRAGEISAVARDHADQTEAARSISDRVVAQMHDADIFRMMSPECYGGYEYGFDALVPVVAALAMGCGSSGWVCSLGIAHQWLAATYPKLAQDEYWSEPDVVSFGSYAPVGRAVPTDGGYLLSGTWGFTSGCDHARWLFLGGLISGAGEGAPVKPALFWVPRRDVRIEDNWFTMGLAGTGSKNSVVTNTFVPEHRVVSFGDLMAGSSPGAAAHAKPLYRQSMMSALPFALVAPVLGMAEGALRDFVDMVKVRTTRGAVAGGNNRMAEFATIQSRVAEASASIQGARQMILYALSEAYAAAEAGTQSDLDLRMNNRLTQSFSVRLLVQALDALFLASGGQGIFTNKPLQRNWRDAHAAAVHVSLNWDAVSTMYGQHTLGLEPKGQY
jgi:resorcinol 4-hydroxylase (FADH2)